jgi:hypothetical protein
VSAVENHDDGKATSSLRSALMTQGQEEALSSLLVTWKEKRDGSSDGLRTQLPILAMAVHELARPDNFPPTDLPFTRCFPRFLSDKPT